MVDDRRVVRNMSSVSAGGGGTAELAAVREFTADHKWKLFAVTTTLFWFVLGYLIDLVVDWDLAGGVTAAFAFVWLFNLVFVAVFLHIIKVATRWAEQ